MATSLDLEHHKPTLSYLHVKLFLDLGLRLICLHMLHIIDLD